jgi:hypothetical protein
MREHACLDMSRPKQRTAKEPLTLTGRRNSYRLIICNDWPTTLKCSITFEYIKDDGSRDDTESSRQRKTVQEQSKNSDNSKNSRVIIES